MANEKKKEAAEEIAQELNEELLAEEEQSTGEEQIAGDAANDTEAPAQEEPADDVCPYCGRGTVAPGHDYCAKCEEKLRKTRIPFVGWIAGVLSLAATVFCLMMVCLLAAPSLQVVKGDMLAKKNTWFEAYQAYAGVSGVSSEIKGIIGDGSKLNALISSGYGLKSKIFATVVKIYDPIRAIQNQAFSFGENPNEKYLKKDKLYQECKAVFDRYTATYSVLTEPISILNTLEKPTVESGKTIISLMEQKRGEEGVDGVLLDYFIYNVTGFCMFDEEQVAETLRKVDESNKNSEYDYYWLYYQDYANQMVKEGKYDEAMPYIERLMQEDASKYQPVALLMRINILKGDLDAADKVVEEYCAKNKTEDGGKTDSDYSLLINMARVRGNYDQALAMIEEAEAIYAQVPEFSRQKALISIVKGNYNDAFKYAVDAEDKAYYLASAYSDNSAYTDEVLSTTYLATYLCKQAGPSDDLKDKINEVSESYSNYTAEGKLRDIIDGKITAKQALTEGACDLI